MARIELQERVRAKRARVAERIAEVEERIDVVAATAVRGGRITVGVVFAAAAIGMVVLLIERMIKGPRRVRPRP